MRKRGRALFGFGVLALCISIVIGLFLIVNPAKRQFNKKEAFSNLQYQVDQGPRIPGSLAHQEVLDWMAEKLNNSGWVVEFQSFSDKGLLGTNLIAKRGSGDPWIILGAHYDSRMFADKDPLEVNQDLPVPGANDGASGVAVLLELARVLPVDLDKQIWIVFFDLEDQGRINGLDWIIGSRYFVNSLRTTPDSVIIIDMIGDSDLQFFMERNSDPLLANQIWASAKAEGFEDFFIPEAKFSILDDHTPFLEKGMHAIDIIDFDYPYFHTTSDTTEKTSPRSLEIVGMTLIHWLLR